MAADYDSPWKEAIEAYLEDFLALLFPDVHRQIDWSRGYEWLDKEFQQVVREAELGRRYVDKLVKVWTPGGEERWVLIHIEVQTERDTDFAQRIYVYNYRIFDRYNRPVASLGVLADDDPNWRPSAFQNSLFGCEAGIRFPTVKLLDLAARESELEASPNRFSKVVLAHLKARQTKGEPADRYVWKLRLVRGLYERGFTARDVRELFRLIDWLMELPAPLAAAFQQDLHKIEEERGMAYRTSIERLEHARGLRRGITAMLSRCFGEEGRKVIPDIEAVYDEEQLDGILQALEGGATIEEVHRLCSVPASEE
jgi:hypothetical protein